MDQNYQKIIDTYMSGYSVSGTARICHVSAVKVRRILITENLWSSEKSEEIRLLADCGKNVQEIADILNVSVKAVEAYMPYRRVMYNAAAKTDNSVRSKEYRTRIRNAREYSMKGGMSGGAYMSENNKFKTMLVRVSLVNRENDYEVERVLREYGQVTEGNTLSRDIVIPDDMPLYAMHYCILRAFGFLNEHMHRFTLPKETNQKLVKSVKEWIALCGVLYRSPLMEEECYVWADDYENGSFRKWQRSKYTGPYVKQTPGESYEECQADIEEFMQRHPRVSVGKNEEMVQIEDCPLDTWNFMLGYTIYDLRECLTVSELLRGRNHIDRIMYEYDFGDGWEFEITEIHHSKARDSVIRKAEETCMETHRPVCVAHEGGFLVEDAGGLYG